MIVPPLLAAIAVVLTALTHMWAFGYVAAVLIALWLVYVFDAPRALGKRADGTLSPLAWIAWAPVFAYQWLAHEVVRRCTTEPVASEVGPGVWVGRRPRDGETPPGSAAVIDLCAEFAAAKTVRAQRSYLAIPTLDARAPSPEQLLRIVDHAQRAGGPVFVHCALGHGRSATAAAAILVCRGDAALATVEVQMQAKRPKIALNARQRRALAEAVARHGRPIEGGDRSGRDAKLG